MAKQPKVKRLYLGFGDAYVPPSPPVVACLYPFLMTDAQAIGAGLAGAIPATGQVATYTTIGALGADANRATGPDLALIQSFPLTTGKTVFEAELVTPTLVSASAGVSLGIGVHNADTFAPIASMSIARGGYFAGSDLAQVNNAGVSVYTGTTASNTNVIGFELDADANTVTVKFNGTDLTLSSNTMADVANACIIVTLLETAGVEAGDVGKQFVCTLRTDASTITQTYSSGAVTVCGETL